MFDPAQIRPKLIYLARRNPEFARADWTARWRRHGALGMSLPRWKNVARYVHCDLMDPAPDQRAYLADHDGIGLIWHRSIAHRDAHFADTTSQEIMVRDEEQTFARPIALDCLSAREQVLRDPAAPGDAVKLFAFLPAATDPATPANALGHVRNLPLPHPQGRTWGLGCASVEEFWFAAVEAAEETARALHERSGAVCVIGRDVELYRA